MLVLDILALGVSAKSMWLDNGNTVCSNSEAPDFELAYDGGVFEKAYNVSSNNDTDTITANNTNPTTTSNNNDNTTN